MIDAPAAGLCERVLDEGAVVEWVLDAPARKNAITPAMLRFIARRCAALSGEVVVIRGEGPGFSSGFDLVALAEAGREDAQGESALPDATLVAATSAMSRANATFVAAVHGFAIGAAVELSCACDLRIASDDATFRIPAAKLGVVYHAEGIARLRATFGTAIATRLLLLGDRIGAAEAEAAGALARRVPTGQLSGAIDDVVKRLCEVDRTGLAANRDLLRTLARAAISEDARLAHERARMAAYARIQPATVKPVKTP